jgi:hypothetical protein
MIAYSKTALKHLHIQQEANEAFENNCISETEYAAIKTHYPVPFYTPHFFIRVGLLLLTAVIGAFTFGLFFMISLSSSIENPAGLLFFFMLLSYGALEYFVKNNQHYRSGVDDALLWMTVIFFTSGLNCIDQLPLFWYAAAIFLLTSFLSLRFADALMSAIACLSFAGTLFFAYMEIGDIATLTMPFVMMLAAAVLYMFSYKMERKDTEKYYTLCLLIVEVVALLGLYVAGNYFVVREMGNSMFQLNLNEKEGIPLGWLFWAFTTGIPLLYMYRGVQKKDPVLLRTGLLLIAVMIWTIRFYYHVMPIEIAMIAGGILITGISYILIRYLKNPRQGFMYKETKEGLPIGKLQIEALVINQSFAMPQTPEVSGTRFGGGSGGGAGAGGDY